MTVQDLAKEISEDLRKNAKPEKTSTVDITLIISLITWIITTLYSLWQKNHNKSADIKTQCSSMGPFRRFILKRLLSQHIKDKPELQDAYKELGDSSLKKTIEKIGSLDTKTIDEVGTSISPNWSIL